MAETIYKTSDGQEFSTKDSTLAKASAENWQAQLDSNNSKGSVHVNTSGADALAANKAANDNAQQLFDKGDYDGAIEVAVRKAKSSSRDPDQRTLQIIGRSYMKKNDYNMAVGFFTYGISKANIDAVALLFIDRAMAYKAKGEMDNTINDLKMSADIIAGDKAKGLNVVEHALQYLKNMGINYTPAPYNYERWYDNDQSLFKQKNENIIDPVGNYLSYFNKSFSYSLLVESLSSISSSPFTPSSSSSSKSGIPSKSFSSENPIPKGFTGKGKYIYDDGDIFEGNIYNGFMSEGKKIFTNGDIYEGEFLNGIPDGKGKMTYANGKVKKGKWKFGQLKGLFG